MNFFIHFKNKQLPRRSFNSFYLIIVLIFGSCSMDLTHEKTPVIYITDLYHPFNDPDDHFDLAAIYALKQFDIKAVIIDYANNNKIPGKIPVEQLNRITGRETPCYLGLKNMLKTPDDKGEDQLFYQDGCKAILNILKQSNKKVIIICVGSLRDVTASYNRNPILFKRKVDKLIVFAGEARNKEFIEYNVGLDKNAYIKLMNKLPNIWWVPCFDGGLWQNNGYASFWRDQHVALLKEAPQPVLNFFIYALSQSADTIGYIPYLYKSVNKDDLQHYILDNSIPARSLWCCSVFPYFEAEDKASFPFTFEKTGLNVENNAELKYSDRGNQVMRFRITDMANYSSRMTKIYNSLIKQLN